jgi:hypothetical protein
MWGSNYQKLQHWLCLCTSFVFTCTALLSFNACPQRGGAFTFGCLTCISCLSLALLLCWTGFHNLPFVTPGDK